MERVERFEMPTSMYAVDGMVCESCMAAVLANVNSLSGVTVLAMVGKVEAVTVTAPADVPLSTVAVPPVPAVPPATVFRVAVAMPLGCIVVCAPEMVPRPVPEKLICNPSNTVISEVVRVVFAEFFKKLAVRATVFADELQKAAGIAVVVRVR